MATGGLVIATIVLPGYAAWATAILAGWVGLYALAMVITMMVEYTMSRAISDPDGSIQTLVRFVATLRNRPDMRVVVARRVYQDQSSMLVFRQGCLTLANAQEIEEQDVWFKDLWAYRLAVSMARSRGPITEEGILVPSK